MAVFDMRVLSALACCAMSFLLTAGCEEKLYPSGRDTYISFGNGRFQITRSSDGYKQLSDSGPSGPGVEG